MQHCLISFCLGSQDFTQLHLLWIRIGREGGREGGRDRGRGGGMEGWRGGGREGLPVLVQHCLIPFCLGSQDFTVALAMD